MVDLPPPEDGQNHEYAAVGCINPAETGRLKGRHDAVKNQDHRAQQGKPGAFALEQTANFCRILKASGYVGLLRWNMLGLELQSGE